MADRFAPGLFEADHYSPTRNKCSHWRKSPLKPMLSAIRKLEMTHRSICLPDLPAVLTGVTRWVAQLTSRPAILVTGSIQFLPGGARASARLLDLHSGRDTLIDATTEELSTLQNKVNGIEALLGRVQPPTSASPSAKAEDLRQTADQLAALALVLACKIRYLESQTAGASYRPSSWETICVFTAACAKLD